ncbi:hypothetical protein K4B79_21275 [Streptomyces lincolnensis]|nr:hypothetical protein [Streptomyces lincolnensis]MCD7440746.1 hypothetical protein [Streptomyces lincolnensis]
MRSAIASALPLAHGIETNPDAVFQWIFQRVFQRTGGRWAAAPRVPVPIS